MDPLNESSNALADAIGEWLKRQIEGGRTPAEVAKMFGRGMGIGLRMFIEASVKDGATKSTRIEAIGSTGKLIIAHAAVADDVKAEFSTTH